MTGFDWAGASVLITGGTGSFGNKMVEVLLRDYAPRRVVIFSRDELKQHEMRLRFANAPSVRYFIGDVRDRDRLNRAFYGVDVVIHAAALKQVPAAEYNPFEAVQTNIVGAKNVIDAAIDNQVSRVVALSTDKAVNPVNLYGATKLVAEKLFIQGNAYASGRDTRLSCVRYGNVIGSRGSVVPLFMEQRETGKIGITDERMTRFWITLEQGVQLVMRAVDEMRGGEVFVPKIPSMHLTDLAKAVAPGCEWEITGIRPGEKVDETLVGEDESRHTIELDDLFVIEPQFPWWTSDPWPGGRPMEEGTRYGSDNNPMQLSVEALRALIQE
jgi:UDP-N-acetylglucosamine 4,6-dehydratase